MKNKILCIMFIFVLLFSYGCSSSKCHSDNLSEYTKWNSFTSDMLENHFNNALPNLDIVNSYGKEYDYQYEQAVFGDSNFHIYVSLAITDNSTFELEIERLTSLYKSIINKQFTYYIVQGDIDDINEYCNEEIYDGMDFFFEIIVVDNLTHNIEYLSAYQWDYNKDDIVYNILLPLLNN